MKNPISRLYGILLALILMILLSQIPACVIVCIDDAGQIDYNSNKVTLKSSINTFAFPLRLFISAESGNGALIFISNMVLLSVIAFIILFVKRRLNKLSST